MDRIKADKVQWITRLNWLLFTAVPVIYFLFYGSYVFFFQEKSALFLFSFGYLSEHLSQPGGFLAWLGKLITAFYRYRVAAAFLLPGLILSVVVLMIHAGKKLTGRTLYFLPFLTGAVLIYLQSQYYFHVVNTAGIILQLLLFCCFLLLKNKKAEWLSVLLFPFWYYLTGSFSLIFAFMFTAYLAAGRGRSLPAKVASLAVVMAVTLIISGEFLFHETYATLLLHPFSVQQSGMQGPEFAMLALLVSSFPLLVKIRLKPLPEKGILRPGTVFPLLAAMLVVAGLSSRYDSRDRHYFHVEDLFYQGRYDEVVAYNLKYPTTNKLTLFLNNVALAETGQLTERLLEFPQSPDGSTLALKWEISGEVLKRGGHFYYALGLVNEAGRWAYEYMVMRGLTPEGLKLMIKVELINGNYTMAEKYVRLLRQSLFYRKEALAFEKLLYHDDLVEAHPELGSKRKLLPLKDFFVLSEEPAMNLVYISAASPAHPVSLEYQLAWLLLRKDVDAVAGLLPMLEAAGYKKLPRYVEEAVVGYTRLQNKEIPELKYLKVQPGTEERFHRYFTLLQQNGSSREQAQRALHPQYSTSYWYYLLFR